MLGIQIIMLVGIAVLLIFTMLLVRFIEKCFLITSRSWVKFTIEIVNMLVIVIGTVLAMFEIRDLVLVPPDIYLADSGNFTDDGTNIMAPASVEIDAPFFLDIYYTVDGTDPSTGKRYRGSEGITLSNPAQVLACTKFLWLYSDTAERYFRIYDPDTATQYIELESLDIVETKTLKAGEKIQLEVFPEPENTSNAGYLWESDNTRVASVQGNGRTCIVTGHEPGVATVKVSASQNSEICTLCFITVMDNVQPDETPDERRADIQADTQANTVSAMAQPGPQNKEWNAEGNKENSGKSDKESGVESSREYAEDINAGGQGGAEVRTSYTSEEITAAHLERIDVRTLPDVLNYRIGDRLDLEGLSLTAYYDDGTEAVISSGFRCSPRHFSRAGVQDISVSYGGFSTEFQVEVEEEETEVTTDEPTEETEAQPVHVDIQTRPDRTKYEAGEYLDSYGLSLAVRYDDGSVEIVSRGFQCSPILLDKPGEQTITVSYQHMNTFFTVTVNEKPPVLTDISAEIEKPAILEGETTQIKVTAFYSDGAQKDITEAALLKSEDFLVASVDQEGRITGMTAGSTRISASFEGFYAEASVTVKGEDRILLNTDSIDGLSVWGETINISVTANGYWTGSSDSSWVTFHPDQSEISGSAGEYFLVLHIITHENLSRGSTWEGTSFPERTADITFQCGDSTAVLHITQNGYSRN